MLRFGFVTCVQLGLRCMDAIHAAGGRLDVVLTLHDQLAATKSGRVFVDDFCGRHDVPLAKITNINDADALAAIRAADLDWLFIVGWSQIARDGVLTAPRGGVLGIHPTLLPEGRGRAAIPWAILKGLSRTGVTLFKLDSGVDTGPVLAQKEIAIGPAESATSLYSRVEVAHGDLIHEAWPSLSAGRLEAMPQDESRATVWPGRRPEDGRLSGNEALEYAECLVRAVTRPYPGAFMDFPWGRVLIWAAQMELSLEAGVPVNADALQSAPYLPFQGGRLKLTDFEVTAPIGPE